jgi:hypothetical protein
MTPDSTNPQASAGQRQITPASSWRLPMVAPPGLGVITPACEDRHEIFPVPLRTAVGLRIGAKSIFVLPAARRVQFIIRRLTSRSANYEPWRTNYPLRPATTPLI